jgi:cytochrome b561
VPRRASSGTDRYSAVAIAFHWTIAALVVVNLAIGLLHDALPRGSISLHKSIGLTVLALTLARVAWRLTHRPPPLPAATPRWQRATAHGVHWALYALMILLPLSGWVMVSANATPRPLAWFGLPVPLLPMSPDIGPVLAARHAQLGWTMLALVVLHVGAALWHHLIRRDGTLARMAPFSRR